jgi:hypothetical protein
VDLPHSFINMARSSLADSSSQKSDSPSLKETLTSTGRAIRKSALKVPGVVKQFARASGIRIKQGVQHSVKSAGQALHHISRKKQVVSSDLDSDDEEASEDDGEKSVSPL